MTSHKIAYLVNKEPKSGPDFSETGLVENGLCGLDYEMTVNICTSQGETIEAVKGSEVVISYGVPIDRVVIESMDKAKAVVSMGHGFNQIDHHAATDNGLMVVNTAGVVTLNVADHTIMLILACARKLVVFNEMVKTGGWRNETHESIIDDAQTVPAIIGSVLGIVGLGNIGLATARRAQALGMRVIGYDPYLPSWIARDNRIEMVDALLDLARDSDFVSILIPLSAETRALIDETFFVEMKPSAYIINTCRGPVVEESDLIQALREGEIAGAGLDVFEEEPLSLDNPLLEMDNVILTPHMGGASFMSIGEGLCRLGEEAARVLAGTLPMSLVNPEVLARISVRPRATRG